MGFAYIIFNICMAILVYYLFRVRKSSGRSLKEKLAPILRVFRRAPAEEVGERTVERVEDNDVEREGVNAVAERGEKAETSAIPGAIIVGT